MGNTLWRKTERVFAQDHPHLRGEYYGSGNANRDAAGSPPPTWGIPFGNLLYQTIFRITPTYVGNTDYFNAKLAELWDHPHLRGEYLKTVLGDC